MPIAGYSSPESEADEALEDRDWTVVPEGSTRTAFPAPSGTLAAVTMGADDAPRVILVPGVTGSKEDFSIMLPLLAAAGFRVESYDQAGQYESADAGRGRRYDYDLFVADLLAVLEAGRTPAHVLGYSFAGTVAQLALARRPELFASLTLLSCPPEPGQGFRGVKRIGWISGLTTGRIGAALMMWGIRRNFVPVPPGRLRFVRDRMRVTNRASVGDIIGEMMRAPDVRAAVAAAPIPKLVAVGEHDLWPLPLHRAFAERINARMAVYRSGHSPCETSPHQLSRDLLELYRSASGSADPVGSGDVSGGGSPTD